MIWLNLSQADDSDVVGHIAVPKLAAKNRRKRNIPIDTAVARLLLRAGELGSDGEPLVPGDYAKARKSACRRIGYPIDITLRDLRHCMATYGSMGGDLVAVQTILGHRDLRTTSRYLHRQREAVRHRHSGDGRGCLRGNW